jgi:ABC-type branched-subunit amino acid transport system ATPase component/ABC-type branched-subunit amino acid transport system permease subunit
MTTALPGRQAMNRLLAAHGLGAREVRRTAIVLVSIAAAVAAAKLILAALEHYRVYTFSTPLPVVVLGAIIGMTYGLLGAGLVLIYRTNRIINFAHGQIGAFGAALFGLSVVRYHVPYWIMFPVALAASGMIGAAVEAGAVRRLRRAPKLVSVVATLGAGQFLVVFAQAMNSSASAGSRFPEPSFLPTLSIGALRITPAYFGMLVLTPVVVIGLAAFLRLSRFGLALRGAAANPEAARMAGIFAGRMSSLAWLMAGAMSAFSAILTQPTTGFTSGQSFGPSLLLRAMTCAVVARMQSIPAALGAGVGLGISEQLLLWKYPQSGLVEAMLFVVILAALLVQRRQVGRDEEKGSWAAVQALRPVPEPLRAIWLVRNLGRLVAGVAVAGAAVLPLLITNATSVDFSTIFAFSIVGLSISFLTGLGGQLTLGNFAVAAIGATVSYHIAHQTNDYAIAIVYAGLVAAVVSVLLGLPALRIRGLMLSVTTLSFALATPAWLLIQPWMLGGGSDPGQPSILGHRLDTGKSYYYFALAALVLCSIIANNVRRSGFGRLLVAVRDNEDNARAFTVPANLVKLQGYLLGGFLAGIGGAVYSHSLFNIGASTFPTATSVDIVRMVVIGGISVLSGPIIGAFYVLGIPMLPLDTAGLAATQLGGLLLILFLPAGLVSALTRVRDPLVRWIGRRHGIEWDSESPSARPMSLPPAAAVHMNGHGRPVRASVLLEARDLRKRFGGVVAVDGVSFKVRGGETIGLIGPNGAGKTTTFELLGGFQRPDIGTVVFDHRDVTRRSPEARARLGLIRSFQDAALFPTLTVLEVVKLGLERSNPSKFLGSVTGLPFAERDKTRRARELVSWMGLDSYRDKQVQELSTGTRRITEIACLVALQPRLLLLDEPSSGIAQRETEALGGLLMNLKTQLGLTLLVIEHDIPLIMGISDRIVAMADGRVICEGTPAVVKADPAVVESYLGGSLTAIERSGPGREKPTVGAPA